MVQRVRHPRYTHAVKNRGASSFNLVGSPPHVRGGAAPRPCAPGSCAVDIVRAHIRSRDQGTITHATCAMWGIDMAGRRGVTRAAWRSPRMCRACAACRARSRGAVPGGQSGGVASARSAPRARTRADEESYFMASPDAVHTGASRDAACQAICYELGYVCPSTTQRSELVLHT